MYKSATKCNETIGKWCKTKHRASKIIDTFETYHSSISATLLHTAPSGGFMLPVVGLACVSSTVGADEPPAVRILQAPKHLELSLVNVPSSDEFGVSKESLALEQGVIVGSSTDLNTRGAGEEEAPVLNNIDGAFRVGVAHPCLF
jgi:hypothetical protein